MKANEFNANEVREDALNLTKVIAHIFAMKYKDIRGFMTVFAYAVLYFLWNVADLNKRDRNDEVGRFLDFLANIHKTEAEVHAKADKDRKAEIIKMN